VCASLFFYSWWNPPYLLLIGFSILFNFGLGSAMSSRPPRSQKLLLLIAVSGNLSLLGYFKYANFFAAVADDWLGTQFHLNTIILPLAVSFFTLQQLAYVIDAYRGEAPNYSFLRFSLFVTFFPQLIAGPIVHHRKLIPQFAPEKLRPINTQNLALGLSIFFAGMFKKIAIADQLIPWVNTVFSSTDPLSVSTLDSWIGTYAYTFQLYFDFSGYSDMAIGAALILNIKLPINFNSPYKANNIRATWRSWHITLSDFVMRYVYRPLGASKRGSVILYRNLFIAFLVTGIWHGAGWTFIVFGALHGIAVIAQQAWKDAGMRLPHWLGVFVTFHFWLLTLVIFRSPDLSHALHVYQSLFEFSFPSAVANQQWLAGACLAALLCLVWFAPNTGEIFREKPKLELTTFWQWRPTAYWGVLIGTIAIVSMFRPIAALNNSHAFIYFQF